MPRSLIDSLSQWSVAPVLSVAMAAATVGYASLPAKAAVLRLGPLVFSEAGGDFVLTGGQLLGSDFVLEQDVYGPNINLFIAIDGLRSVCPNRGGCFFSVRSFVTNLTGTPWILFDKELQEVYGVASPEEDGLSFAQGINEVRPFSSSLFAGVDEVTDVRDFVNYSAGTVAPGARVEFRYVIADTTPLDRFYLLQRPNFQVGGGGFVNPTPVVVNPTPIPIVEPIVNPPIVDPVPPPVVDPEPEVPNPATEPEITNPEPENSAAVPEPTTVLGALVFGAIAARWRFQRSR